MRSFRIVFSPRAGRTHPAAAMSSAVLMHDSAIWRASQLPELLTRKQAIEAAAANGLSFTEQLRAYLSSNLSRVIDLLREWDEDEDGYVDRAEFRKALPALGLAIDRQGADELYDTFDADGSGLITLEELTRQLRAPGEHEHVEFATSSKNAIELRGELEFQEKRSKIGGMQALGRDGLQDNDVPLIDQIKQALAGGFGKVMDIFREWDEDGSGTITKKEFRRALPLLGLRLEKKDADDFFDSFDRDLSGEVDYRELHSQLRLRVSDRQSTKRSKRLSPEKRAVGASLVGGPNNSVAAEAEIAERGMHSALQKAEAEARQKLIRVQRELARVASQSARANIRRNNRAVVVEVQQDIKQRIGEDLSSKFKNVRVATDEEVQDLADTLCVRMATLPDASANGRERFDWYIPRAARAPTLTLNPNPNLHPHLHSHPHPHPHPHLHPHLHPHPHLHLHLHLHPQVHDVQAHGR